MPYVPKDDRPALDAAAKIAAVEIAKKLETGKNYQLVKEFGSFFNRLAEGLWLLERNSGREVIARPLAKAIYDAGAKHGYQGAVLGELNYTITRFLQHVPRAMIELGKWKETDEFRYWLYACMCEALINASDNARQYGMGIGGVFEDIKDEYKWRVNRPYETAQIIKSGDCYDAPYYNRLVGVYGDNGLLMGYMYLDMVRPETYKRDGETHPDVVGGIALFGAPKAKE